MLDPGEPPLGVAVGPKPAEAEVVALARRDDALHLGRALRREDAARAERAATEMGRGEQRRIADGPDQSPVRGAIEIEGIEQPPFPGGCAGTPSRHQEAHKRQQGIAAWMRALAPGLAPLGGKENPVRVAPSGSSTRSTTVAAYGTPEDLVTARPAEVEPMFEYADRHGLELRPPVSASSRSTIAGPGPSSPAGWIQRSGAGFTIPELWLTAGGP